MGKRGGRVMNPHDMGKRFERELAVYWRKLGIEVIRRYTTKADQRTHGDFLIRESRQKLNVDAKIEQKVTGNFPVEIMQDWRKNDLGWYHTLVACDEIWYAQSEPTDRELNVRTVHRISMAALKGVTEDQSARWRTIHTTKWYGSTLLMLAPLSVLETLGVAKKEPYAEFAEI